jgi:hypothetical protein
MEVNQAFLLLLQNMFGLIFIMHSLQCTTKLTDNVTNKAHKLSVTAVLHFLASRFFGLYCHMEIILNVMQKTQVFQGDCFEYHTKDSGLHVCLKYIKMCVYIQSTIYLGQKFI